MKLRTTLLAATAMALALPLAAQAQPVTGLYIGAGAGLNFKQNQNIGIGASEDEYFEAYSNPNARTSYRKPGLAVVGSVGWGFGNGLRAEIEGSWRENSARTHNTGNLGDYGYGGGRTSTYAVMGNVFYDFNNLSPMIVPYVGAGVGYAWQRNNNVYNAAADDSYTWTHDTSGAFAWQLMAGAAFPIAAIPGLSLTAEYRFFSVLSSHVNARTCNDDYGCYGIRANVGTQYNHSVLLGARYEFNKAPAPVPVAAAAPVPAGRSFMVFFDWDKFNLTDRARAVIRDAAATSKSVQHTRLEVNGYADTSGNPKYNMGLSMKRAQTVAAELVRNGVAKNEIVIKAFGDTVLLVPTGPGVREPQNRRVEIIIR